MRDVVLSQLLEQIRKILEEGIGMECTKFVSSTLGKICNSEHNLSSQDLINYAVIIKEFHLVALDCLSAFRVGGSIVHGILLLYLTYLSTCQPCSLRF